MKQLLLTALCIGAATVGFADIRALTPVQATGASWWSKRHAQKRVEAVANQPKVVFIGDSITHGWEGAGKAQWKKYFSTGDRRAVNLGFGADRTEHVLWRITEGHELDGYKAKAIVLMIGTNNSGHFMLKDEPPIDTIVAIREILHVIAEKQPEAKIILCPIFPRNFDDKGELCAERNAIVNKEICKYADGEHVFWCDFTSQLLTADGKLPYEVFPDQLHPRAYGYEVWASAVIPYIDSALEDRTMPPNRYGAFVNSRTFMVEKQSTALFPVTRIAEDSSFRGFDWWSKRLREKRNQIANSNGKIDLVFFGDSITHNWESHGKAQLAELEKTYSILDIGYGGDHTEHLLWRGMNGELTGYEAKCIMLMIGTNNRNPPEETAAGVKEILELIAEKQPQAKTLLLPIFPRGKSAEDGNRVRNEKINAIIKTYADGDKVVWCDFNAKFLDANGDTKLLMNDDRLHPNAEGYKIWSAAVLPYFQKFVGK